MRGRKVPVWIGLCALLALLTCLPSRQAGRQIPAPETPAPQAESVGPEAAVSQQRAASEKALPGPAPAPMRFTVLFFNDLHGYLLPFTVKQADATKAEVGGIARMATLIKRIRAENDGLGRRTLVLVAGDILQGTPMSTVFHGEPDVEALNAVGVNGLAVGNHEFDFGLENFQALRQRARFPFISSNLVWKDSGRTVCDPAVSLPVTDRVSLTVIGATTGQLLTSTKPDNVALLNVVDPVATVREAYERGSEQGPVILLSHSKAEADEELARAVPGLLAIIGGHDQILLNPCKQIGGVFVFQAFEKGRYLGRFDVEFDPQTGKAAAAGWTYMAITAEIPEDPEIKALVESYHGRLDQQFKQVIGKSMVFMDGEREHIRYEETTLGNFVTDIMRNYTGADLALLNAGSLRASIDQGPITLEEVFNAMPYENELVKVDLRGDEIIQVLRRAVMSTRQEEDGGFLHVSGLRFKVKGKTPVDILAGGRPLEPGRSYVVAITDFMASGGDGYDLLKTKAAQKTGSPLRELIVDSIRQRGEVSARKEGRIVRLD